MDEFAQKDLIDVGIEACAAELLKNHYGDRSNPAVVEAQKAQALASAYELRPVFTAIAAMIAHAVRGAL